MCNFPLFDDYLLTFGNNVLVKKLNDWVNVLVYM